MAEWRRKEYLVMGMYLLGIFLGTAAALWVREDLLTELGIYSELFRESLESTPINAWDYLLYILRQRAWSMGILLLLSLTSMAYPCLCAFSLYYGFCLAGMVVAATASMGMMGFFGFLISILPHYIFYCAAVLLTAYTVCRQPYAGRKQAVQTAVFAVVLFLSGVFVEVYGNPLLMKVFGGLLAG